MRSLLKVGFALALLTLSSAAFADTVSFSYGDGSTLFVQGALTGTFSGDVFTATSATGTYNGTSISLVAPGVDGNFLYNNQVYFPAASGYSVDTYGLLFTVAGLGDVNLCAGTGCAGFDAYTSISNFGGIVNTNVNATFDAPTPEQALCSRWVRAFLAWQGWRASACSAKGIAAISWGRVRRSRQLRLLTTISSPFFCIL